MSCETAIRVANLSKCYHIYEKPHDRLKQSLYPRLQRAINQKETQYFREFWALKNISFEVKKGETVGILGKNGSGKSTLLQLICGTLNPTSGTATTTGRIAALLELGAGFNPEFSGRENVYLNGAVLGLTKDEIDNRFEEIAAFADIGYFIDQPVKTYSSGMYVRLAFAVQACVDPEILVIDEALSVGDIGFQYKCFKRMEALREKGVTILMVTHSSGSILEYADRCIVLRDGTIQVNSTDVLSAVLTYEKGMLPSSTPLKTANNNIDSNSSYDLKDLSTLRDETVHHSIGEKRFGTARAVIEEMVIYRADGQAFTDSPLLRSGEEVTFQFKLTSSEEIIDVVLGISISRTQGADIWGDNNLAASTPLILRLGEQYIQYKVKLPISTGDYLIHCGLACVQGTEREELDQRRPIAAVKFWSPREQFGVVHAPIKISMGQSS